MSNVNSTQIIPTTSTVFSLMLMLLNPKQFLTQSPCFATMHPIREIFFGQIQKVKLPQRSLLDGGTAVFRQKYWSIPTEILQYSDKNIEVFRQKYCSIPTEILQYSDRNTAVFQQKYWSIPTEILQNSDRNKCVGPICEMCGRAAVIICEMVDCYYCNVLRGNTGNTGNTMKQYWQYCEEILVDCYYCNILWGRTLDKLSSAARLASNNI